MKHSVDAYKSWDFRKNCANEWPVRGKFVRKIINFETLGAIFSYFCPDKCENWHGATVPNYGAIYRGNMLPLRGENPIFGQLSKTIPAWLRCAQAFR